MKKRKTILSFLLIISAVLVNLVLANDSLANETKRNPSPETKWWQAGAEVGLLLPMLSMADIFAVIYYNRHASWHHLWKLFPFAAIRVFIAIYVGEVIDAYGGPERFYGDFYINSPCPLGFIKATEKGKAVNYNYYDSKELTRAVYPFMIELVESRKFLIDKGKENRANI